MKIIPKMEYIAADSINMDTTPVYIFECSFPSKVMMVRRFQSSRVAMARVARTFNDTESVYQHVAKSRASVLPSPWLGLAIVTMRTIDVAIDETVSWYRSAK
jgi:hypothetical protein